MKAAPEPKDVLEFQFKQSTHWKISDGFSSIPVACSLIAVDGKRGLIYTACDHKIIVLKSGHSLDKEWRKEFVMPAKVTCLAFNCNCSYLAVVFDSPTAYIYNAASVVQQQLELLREIKLSSSYNVHILDLRWNPCISGMLCTVTSDHSIGSFNISSDKNSSVLTILEKLEKLDVLCVAWSPKGKQLVVGSKNGSLLQLKPDLKAARIIAGPDPSIGSVIALLWISSYQFCAAYLDPQDSRINVLIIDAPKGESKGIFTCYEDITYSVPDVEGKEGSPPRYYFEHIAEWGLIIAASSTSSEIAVLGSLDNGTTWQQWQLVDSGRAQLPLVRTNETFPVGLAVDRTSVNKLPWGGEGSTLPYPVPILHIFGTSGQLCSFHMVNLMPGIPPVCSPPTETLPLDSEPHPSLAPTEISFNLDGRVTSTPRPKQIEPIMDRPTSAVTTNVSPKTSEVSIPQPQTELFVTKPPIEKIEVSSKVDTSLVPRKELKETEKVSIDSNVCVLTYEEVCNDFEKELSSRKETQSVDIGSPGERTQLIEKSENMQRFLTDLQETTTSLTSDINYLKALLLQTFAWLEETKSKCSSKASSNPQNRGNNNKLKELQNLVYYIQSQLEQAARALDYEWFEHIKKEKNKMKVPRLDFVHQIMLQHSQSIAKMENLIQAQVKKWKTLTRRDITSSLNKSLADMSLSSSVNNKSPSGAIEYKCKAIAQRNCSFTCEKQRTLRNLLNQTTIKVIKAATPSEIQDRLEATISSLAMQSPPKEVQRRKNDLIEKLMREDALPAPPPIPAAKSPLASLDQIVANIGSVGIQPNLNLQNKAPALIGTPASTLPIKTSQVGVKPSSTQNKATASISLPSIKVPQVDGKARIAATLVASQTPSTAQSVQSKPTSAALFGTPPTPHTPPKPITGIPSGMKSVTISEVSPFTSSASRSSVLPLLPSALMPTTITAINKPFSKIDTLPFNSVIAKTEAQSILPTSTTISTSTTTPIVVSTSIQTIPQSSVSFMSTVQTPASQASTYPITLKTSNSSVTTQRALTTTTSVNVTTSQIASFSFATKPASNTPFSFASKSVASPTSSTAQSLDLSVMGLDLQTSNTSIKNVTPTTTVAAGGFFGSVGTSSPGSIFGRTSAILKDKPANPIFGNPPGSSLFGGVSVDSNIMSSFSESATPGALKLPVFGNSPTGLTAPIFGGSAANPLKSVSVETPAVSTATSGFENSANLPSASVFGNVSTTSDTPSIFGGKSTEFSSAPTLGGTTSPPASIFGKANNSPIKPPIFAGDSVNSSTPSVFGRPPDAESFTFGGIPASSTPLPAFGSGPTISTSPSMFGGAISNPQTASIFGGTAPTPSTSSVFGTVTPSNQSIFGGAPVIPTPTTNIGSTSPTLTATAPAFSQTATFGAKPAFGSTFGASKPIFGGGFANTAFSGATQPTTAFGGFGTPSPLGANSGSIGSSSMQKVFGESSGSSTFENLATQEGGLTFGNLAQKQQEPAAPPPFSGGSSFQSWR
ncbi:nuclear pore complex protein Nup214 isoform X1 [Neodiprion virginianus]|uniref:nuclear pore complex protein Nup214 isoform X1 n=2 Tax=Neodiprion virginianus TaxID=2961670 RepID=UPI001EE6EE34|nr:nuclear pore complex protein Nup214 isoform X1 [Neodiprion virginianus]